MCAIQHKPRHLRTCVERSREHALLLFACELHEVYLVATDPHRQLRVRFRAFHCVAQRVLIEDVDARMAQPPWCRPPRPEPVS